MFFLQFFGGDAHDDIHAGDTQRGNAEDDVEGYGLVQGSKDGEYEKSVKQQIREFIEAKQKPVFQRVEFSGIEEADFVDAPETVLWRVLAHGGGIGGEFYGGIVFRGCAVDEDILLAVKQMVVGDEPFLLVEQRPDKGHVVDVAAVSAVK